MTSDTHLLPRFYCTPMLIFGLD